MMFGSFTLIVGSFLYTAYFRQTCFRKVVLIGMLINFFGSFFTLLFVNQIYLGLSPLTFCILTSTVTDTLF
jgi:hypothetical protein